MIRLNGQPGHGVPACRADRWDVDPVNAVYRIVFAPLDGSRLGRPAQREGLVFVLGVALMPLALVAMGHRP